MTKHLIKNTLLAAVTGVVIAGFATGASAQMRGYEQGYNQGQFGAWQNEEEGYMSTPSSYRYGYVSSMMGNDNNACASDAMRTSTTRDFSGC